MPQKHFDEKLDELTERLHQMSHEVEELVASAMGLVTGKAADVTVEDIRRRDRAIDEAEVAIEETAIELVALHQPMASDLRVLVTTIKINNDLERIGDHAVNIAEAADRMAKVRRPAPRPPELDEMGRLARAMLCDALDAFVHRSAAEARDVLTRDDQVDRLQDSLFRVMLTHMPEYSLSGCLQIILIGRNLERIADLATNIGEDVVYLVRGTMVRHGKGSQESA